MHKVPAHRTASLITLKIVASLQVDVVVLRLLTPFLSYHLITNFGNTKIFHPPPHFPVSLRAAQQPRTEIFDKTDL